MKKRKKPKSTVARGTSPKPNEQSPVPAAEAMGRQAQRSVERPPSVMMRTWVSIGLVFHLVALSISLTAVVEPSEIQSQLARLFRSYLQPTHFTVDGRPLYLAYGEPLEQPHRLQVSQGSEESIDEDAWTTIEPQGRPGLASNDRYARWLSTAAMLAEKEESGLVAELLLSVVEQDESIGAIRIIRVPTDLTTSAEDEAPPPYEARVIRTKTQTSLVQLQPTRLSAIATKGEPAGE